MNSDTLDGTARPLVADKTKDELAAIAYGAMEGIEFLEMNDGHRLAMHVYRYLHGEIPSLAVAIYESKSRTQLSADELERTIRERLVAAGVSNA